MCCDVRLVAPYVLGSYCYSGSAARSLLVEAIFGFHSNRLGGLVVLV